MMLHDKYIKYLINNFYKCLCLFEENNDGLTKYISSFIYELEGLVYRLGEEHSDVIQTLLNILERFYDESIEPEPDLEQIRTQVFHCTNLIKKTFKDGDE